MDSNQPTEYILGHSDHEIERLKHQARRVEPTTRRFFQEAGVGAGMRVLDIGSGVGDVAFIAAALVGACGVVVGVERSAPAANTARRRAAERSLSNVSFVQGEAADLQFERPFDAVVGRYVLQFQRDPAGMLRSLAALLRPGGLLVFHEIDWSGLHSSPAVAAFDRCCQWGAETLRRHGTESHMGLKLNQAFVAAGLGEPTMRLDAYVGGAGTLAEWISGFVQLMTTLAPQMHQLGVASAEELELPTLETRILGQMQAAGSAVVSHLQVAAWARTRPAPG
jgi:SAM-dependent methyltransferase